MKVQLKCGKDKLWKVITDNKNFNWRTDVKHIAVKDENHFTEYDKNDYPTHFEITKKDYAKEYCFNIQNGNLSGKWCGNIKDLGNSKTEFTLTEQVVVKPFLMRLLARLYLKRKQRRYVSDLLNELDKTT